MNTTNKILDTLKNLTVNDKKLIRGLNLNLKNKPILTKDDNIDDDLDDEPILFI